MNPEPDLSTPIGQKWYKLGGKDAVGDAISEVGTLTVPNGKYQEFEHGVITYTDDFGALFMPTSIFARWRVPATDLSIGLPTEDAVNGATAIGNQVVTHVRVTFERGLIVRDESNVAFVIESIAATEYLRGCQAAESTCGWQMLGNPIDEAGFMFPVRVQHFTGGAIYYDGFGSAALWGPILTKYADASLPLVLGKPMTRPQDIKNNNGDVIGQVSSFKKNAAIFFSPSTGVHIVSGSILTAYNGQFGGPSGWLGLPIGDTDGDPGKEFSDFQHGMLINHPENDGFTGVNAFGDLALRIAHATISATDGGGGTNETYILYSVSTSTGVNASSALCAKDGIIRCEDGDASEAWDEDISPNKVIPLGVANSKMSISTQVSLWDFDSGFNGADDKFGEWSETADRSNLFGVLSYGIHNAGQGNVTFGIQTTHGYDGSDFMGNRWWSFKNWKTDDITYNQFAEAFDDVSPDESTFFHPFNHIWYEVLVRNQAENGNCVGMALDSIYAEKGLSAFPEPIHDFFPNTQDGQRLGDVTWSNAHATLASEINVKQIYQVGADMLHFYLRTLNTGATHDPLDAFGQVKSALDAGEPMMVALYTFWWGKGHVVRAYDTALGQPCTQGGTSPCNRIIVADPNFPKSKKHIEVDVNGRFYYEGIDHQYSGGTVGDRMFAIPYIGLLDHHATTQFGPFAAIEFAMFMVAGSDGSVGQVTGENGETFFKPNLGKLPATFDDINDGPSGISEMAPIPLEDSQGSQILAVTGHGTYTYDVVATPGVSPDKPVNMAFFSDYMSARATVPGTPGKADQFTAYHINTPSKAVSLMINPAGASKTVQLTIGAPDKYRWAELSNLVLAPGQRITARLSNGGYALGLDNDGPATKADVKVSAGKGATPVVVGTIEIPGGTSNLEYQLPKTTLTVTGQVPGNDGWLLAPVHVELSATDFNGSGIDHIEHRHDADPWVAYKCPPELGICSTGPFEYAFEGDTTLSYRALDRAHNFETAKAKELKIDTRAPIVSAATDKFSYTRVEPFTVHVSATDPIPGSGLRVVSATLDSVPATDGQIVDLLWYALGSHTVAVSAEDVAGWQAAASKGFELIATPESIKALIVLLRTRGEIDSDGITNSFLAKAEQSHWAPLRDEIRAQTGKHISEAAANILDGDVMYVMTH